jgi:hypothetical protein
VSLNLTSSASQAFGAYARTLTFEPLERNDDEILSRQQWTFIVTTKYKRKGKKILPQNVPLPDGINPGDGINGKEYMTTRIL